jgi:hypothetical protein
VGNDYTLACCTAQSTRAPSRGARQSRNARDRLRTLDADSGVKRYPSEVFAKGSRTFDVL